jgi:MOSC domain-containing protein YiiM
MSSHTAPENKSPLSFVGAVASIHLAAAAEATASAVQEVRAVAGRGLEGDRYFGGSGTFSDRPGDGRDVTLIELEALEALRAETGIELGPGDSRRNLATCGVPLNHLVGHQFRVGEVVLRGARLCEPCSHLARLTEAGVLPGLVHRGGLRADIVVGGLIRAGDPILPG